MKVSAHPLMVAVALGLLGPGALASDRSEGSDDPEPQLRPQASPAASDLDLADVAQALDDSSVPDWGRLVLHETDGAELWSPAED